MPINEELISIEASHSIYVNRLASGLGNDAIPFVDKVNAEIAARLEREIGKNLTPSRREKLLEDIHAITADNLKEYTQLVASDNKEFGGYEAGFQAGAVNSLLDNAETVAVSAGVVNNAAKSTLITLGEGSYTTYNEMLKNYWSSNAAQVTNIVANGFQSGTSTRAIANQVMTEVGVRLNKTKKQALSVARTGTNHYANQARKEYFEANDVIVGTRRIATLDSVTSGFCRGIDQTVVLKTDSNYRSAFAPFHPNCRTTNVPEIDSRFAQEDDGDDRASNFRDADSGLLDPKPTNSKNIYYDELAKLDAASQDAVLGVALGKGFRKLLREGGTAEEFAKLTINPKFNKAYTLSELKSQDNQLSKILNEQSGTSKKRKSTKIKPSSPVKKADNNIVNIEQSSKIKTPTGTIKLEGDTIKATPFEVIKRKDITGDESAYLEYYKGEGFNKYNDILRNPDNYDKGEIDSAVLMRDSINRATSKFETSTDASVYRGVRGAELFNSVDESSIGKTISINTPQSTSTDTRVALNYAGSLKVGDDYFSPDGGSVIFKISLPKSSNVIDMEKIVGATGEKEILIPSGGGYKVKSIENRTDSSGNVTLKIINVDLI